MVHVSWGGSLLWTDGAEERFGLFKDCLDNGLGHMLMDENVHRYVFTYIYIHMFLLHINLYHSISILFCFYMYFYIHVFSCSYFVDTMYMYTYIHTYIHTWWFFTKPILRLILSWDSMKKSGNLEITRNFPWWMFQQAGTTFDPNILMWYMTHTIHGTGMFTYMDGWSLW